MENNVDAKKFLRRWGSGLVAVAALSGTVLFSSVAISAAAPAGTLGGLTFTPSNGSDLTAPVARTSGACPATADSANVLIVGPVGAADPIFPDDNPYVVVTTTKASFSTSNPFDLPFRVNLKDAAADRGKTVQAGEYDVTARCVKGLTQEVLGTFTGALSFTSPTAYQTADTGTPETTGPVVTTTPPTSTSVPTTTTTPPGVTPSESAPDTSTPAPSVSAVPTTTSAPSESAPPPTTTTNGGDLGGAGLSSGSASGLSTPTTTGALAHTGGPIGLIFLVGLFVLIAGLALVLALQRRKENRPQDGPSDQPTAPPAGW